MIKIENGIFYMTAGEACCVLATDGDGRLGHLYSGKRLEFEDDLSALGRTGGAPLSLFNGDDLKVTNAVALSEKPDDPSAYVLKGGKTLAVTLADKEKDVAVTLYCTPYPRGGMALRYVVQNGNKGDVTFKKLPIATFRGEFDHVRLGKKGEILRGEAAGGECGFDRFGGAAQRGCGEDCGDTFGVLGVYGNGKVCAEAGDDEVKFWYATGKQVKLKTGETYRSPEIVAVYSDGGLGGMSRVMHDILREGARECDTVRKTVLFCPDMEKEKLCEAAGAACGLGCDVFAIAVEGIDDDTIKSVASACADAGIAFGASFAPGKHGGAVSPEVYADGIAEFINKYGAEYVSVDVSQGGAWARVVPLLGKRTTVAVECEPVPFEKRYAMSLCYPPALMRTTVDMDGGTALKTLFDCATVGRLGYVLDPLSIDGDTARAVRAQILSYQDDAPTVLGGDLYRPRLNNGRCGMFVSKDKSRAYVVAVCGEKGETVRLRGLDEHNLYHVREIGKTFSGAALCACGLPLPATKNRATYTLHLRQVADYE